MAGPLGGRPVVPDGRQGRRGTVSAQAAPARKTAAARAARATSTRPPPSAPGSDRTGDPRDPRRFDRTCARCGRPGQPLTPGALLPSLRRLGIPAPRPAPQPSASSSSRPPHPSSPRPSATARPPPTSTSPAPAEPGANTRRLGTTRDDSARRRPVRACCPPSHGPKADFTHVWMSADGKTVVTADNGMTNLNPVYHEWSALIAIGTRGSPAWDATTGKAIGSVIAPQSTASFTAAAVSPDGRYLAAVFNENLPGAVSQSGPRVSPRAR